MCGYTCNVMPTASTNYLPPITDPANPPTIAVGMSGGVDSNATAYILHDMGYKVIGFTAWTLNGPGKCCNDALINAGRVCEQLGIPYDTVDLRAEFAHYVLNYYNNSYAEGLTPNPCVECNRHVKWEALVDYARKELGADYVATGHYAQRTLEADGSVRVLAATDTAKDQTYMMARVRPDDFKYALFPLGGMTKPEVREIARKANLPEADGKESQDICFVLDGHATYMGQVFGKQRGPIVDIDRDNKTITEHDGFFNFTVGQRKGLGGGADRPVYVIKIDPKTNTVFVGDKQHLECATFTVQQPSWVRPDIGETISDDTPLQVMAQIRYNSPATLATVTPGPEADTLTITMDVPASAVSPGQICGFYSVDGNELWGGGYIQRFLPHATFDPSAITLPTLTEACGIV